MKKKISIINIDGVDGIGKTTQINMLMVRLSQKNIPLLNLQLTDTLQSGLDCAQQTWDFLKQNPDGIVITDGSIAKMLVLDLLNGISSNEIIEHYRTLLHEHECLNHRYGMANILLIMDDMDTCNGRILKRNKLNKTIGVEITDFTKERQIIRSLRQFNTNIISRSLDFHVIETDDSQSIIEVYEEIVDYLTDKYFFK